MVSFMVIGPLLCGVCVSSACWRCSFNTETLTLTNLCTKSLILSIHLRSLHFPLIFTTKENLDPSTSPLSPLLSPPLHSLFPLFAFYPSGGSRGTPSPKLLPRDSSLFQGRQLITMTDKRPRQRRDHLSGRRRLNIPTVVLRAKSCESHVDGLFTIYIKKKKNRGRKKGGRKEQSKATKSNMHAHFLRR